MFFMRMWMVDTKILCRNHLLGEHNELHKHLHNWKKKHRIDGRISGNAIEPLSYKKRHTALVKEMIDRGYNHKSPLDQPDFSYLPENYINYKVNQKESLKMLLNKCPNCNNRYKELNNGFL